MSVDIAVPDFSTLSRRGKGLALPSIRPTTRPSGPVHLVVDSTGLKIFGEGEWLDNKHKIKRKRWRRLYLGLDLISGEIICSELTTDDIGDPTALPGLLGQIDSPVAKVIADGPMMNRQPETFWRHALVRLPRSLFRLPRLPLLASNRRLIHRRETAISRKSRPVAGWLGRNPPATIKAVV